MENMLKFCTWNVRGLKNDKKRKSILRILKNEKFDIIALQETYLNSEDIKMLEKEWGSTLIHYSPGTKNSKGIITLFNKTFQEEDIHLLEIGDRFVTSLITFQNTKITIING